LIFKQTGIFDRYISEPINSRLDYNIVLQNCLLLKIIASLNADIFQWMDWVFFSKEGLVDRFLESPLRQTDLEQLSFVRSLLSEGDSAKLQQTLLDSFFI
jgi:hypothetical protein